VLGETPSLYVCVNADIFIRRMAITRAQKEKIVEALSEAGMGASALLFADFTGVKTKDMNEFRRTIRSVGGSVRVVKKTLAVRAFGDKLPAAIGRHQGGIAAVWFKDPDPLEGLKAAWKFTKQLEALKILGGFIAGLGVVDAAKVREIASLPSRGVIVAKLLGVIASPLSGLVRTLHAPLQNLVRTLSGIRH
jgi:large subunit ribosomal protein L10